MVRFRTIQDLVQAAYGPRSEDLIRSVMKADAPVISSTTGVYNRIFGKMTWELLNNAAKTVGALPKRPLNNTGFRVITARGASLGSGGQAENAALPDSIKPTWAEGSISLKEIVHTFDMSNRQMLLDDGGDDTIGFEELREYMAREHVAHLNTMILADVDTVAGNNMESIDRVCSSQSEESALLNPGDADIYGFDRSASTSFDATVLHNSGTDRTITLALLRQLVDDIEEASGERPTMIVTGFDTAQDIDDLVNTQTRYTTDRLNISFGEEGITTAAGNDVGLRVASFDGIPILRDKDVVKDTKSRIYALNTNHIELAIKLPTQFFESENFFEVDRIGKRGMYYTSGELVARRINAHGKIRDLL